MTSANKEDQALVLDPAVPKKVLTYITLEVHYARNGTMKSSVEPYLREPIPVDLSVSSSSSLFSSSNNLNSNYYLTASDSDTKNSNGSKKKLAAATTTIAAEKKTTKTTFRSFLREGIFGFRPELKYRDNEICFYQTPKGTNLLSILDHPISALTQLLETNEQPLLKVIIKRNKNLGIIVSGVKLTTGRNRNNKNPPPQLQKFPAWPRMVLEPVNENSTTTDFKNEIWRIVKGNNSNKKNEKNRKRLFIAAAIFLLVLVASIAIGIVFGRSSKQQQEGQNQEQPSSESEPEFINHGSGSSSSATNMAQQNMRLSQLMEIVSAISEPYLLEDPDTSQGRAIRWLAFDDGAQLNICRATTTTTAAAITTGNDEEEDNWTEEDGNLRRRKRRLEEEELLSFIIAPNSPTVENNDNICVDRQRILRRYALAVFYFATAIPPQSDDDFLTDEEISIFGANSLMSTWIDDWNFLSSGHECSWHRNATTTTATGGKGVENYGNINAQGVICLEDGDDKNNDFGYVVLDESSLLISEEEISVATIGASFSITLNMTSPNGMMGTIPSELTTLTEATSISIQNQQLHGSIPSTFFFNNNLTNLQILNLGNNKFTGTIPSNADNTTTEQQDQNSNNEILPALEELYLGFNSLKGTIPSSIGLLNKLRVLDLGSNQLSGSLPSNWNKLSNLDTLILDSNFID